MAVSLVTTTASAICAIKAAGELMEALEEDKRENTDDCTVESGD